MNLSRILSKYITGLPRYLRTCAILILIVFIIESIVFNTVILYIVFHLGSTVSKILQAPGASFIDKLAVDPVFKNLVNSGKNGGFKSLIEHTLGRVYMVDESCDSSKGSNEDVKQYCAYPKITSLGIDVSGAGEVMYIYRRMQRHSHKPWTRLIIDIGANDGLMSSNSYNFIQWGWNAILVEPQASQLKLAAWNHQGFRRNPDQNVEFVQGVIGERNGQVKFKLSHDIVSMESHVLSNQHDGENDDQVVQVESFTVAEFARRYDVPKHFGILSIDAEGAGSKILNQWLRQGFRPAYIIYEALHDPESIQQTIYHLEQRGYTFLTKRGWNGIFEYNFKSYNTTNHA